MKTSCSIVQPIFPKLTSLSLSVHLNESGGCYDGIVRINQEMCYGRDVLCSHDLNKWWDLYLGA